MIESWTYLGGELAEPHSIREYRRADGLIMIVRTRYNGWEFFKASTRYYWPEKISEEFKEAPPLREEQHGKESK